MPAEGADHCTRTYVRWYNGLICFFTPGRFWPGVFFEGVMIMEQPQASLAIQVLPKVRACGKNPEGDEVIRIVDAVIAYIKGTGLNTFVGPFETTVEGDFGRIMDIAKECQLICIREGAESVSAYMKVFFNPGEGVWSIAKKVTKHHA
jgi:uncharacterized protein YqgV (UPF0045/DUF77 family)